MYEMKLISNPISQKRLVWLSMYQNDFKLATQNMILIVKDTKYEHYTKYH